tara:strand:+ start:2813 stop:3490 length:678 start_codon:yes stop_codon:yes gene_type:complete
MRIDYIKKSAVKALKERKEKFLFNNILVFLKDDLPETVDIEVVLKKIEETIPTHFFYLIDAIYIGHFDIFDQNQTNAAYKDGAIYVSNAQHDVNDMVDDIVHEIAHSAEKLYGEDLYGDDAIELEFLGKRKRLYQILDYEGYEVNLTDFYNTEYSEKFDELLYREIGYDTLQKFTSGLFVSPYGATSLQEYFANCFEHYYLHNRQIVKKLSPMVYNKLENIGDLT